MVTIYKVIAGSVAHKKGIRPGDLLLSVNENPISDLLDYRFYITERRLALALRRDGADYTVSVRKKEDDDIGLVFDTFLMDKKKSCHNKCVFCFIDQNPPGMREGIYFKDDDTRLSFLHGNYVTLTNTGEKDIARILRMHISPINLSVHTTNPALRCRMLGNKNAGGIVPLIERLTGGGITVNCQIVLCKGLNDGAELDRTLRELAVFHPLLASIAVVPAGLTRYRQSLYPLEDFDREESRAAIRQIERISDEWAEKHKARFIFASDEFYVKAGLAVHDEAYYEEYPQLDNGVGIMASMRADILREIEFQREQADTAVRKRVSAATGEAAYSYIRNLVEEIQKTWYNIECTVYQVENRFYGRTVTVSGLLTGSDYYAALRGKDLGEALYISASSLRFEQDLFLDGMSLRELSEKLGVPVIPCRAGEDFLLKLTE